ncbi:MAG: hypothetical protein RML93_09435 [Anaerolineales bacterium]|nr:hypothetical protein [Anaerolineales bacterium]MCS7247606.1 hypothetical protein [Anaerolineales bacterium]MDW8161417.1 hypothetical protein [Anaerolineales bacterium]MDW8447497.1 hypothetical protein [Anaerolineales bacterium]
MSLDQLREQASSQPFAEEEGSQPRTILPERERRFLGLTAFQRFVLSVLLFIVTCMVGSFFLLVTQRVVLPFLNY